MPTRGESTKLLEFRDGCKAQFQGRHAFLFYSLFERLTGVVLCNVCCEAEDGKGAADGLSRVVSQGARTLALHGHNPGSEARGLFQMVAAHRPGPQVSRILKRELTSATHYLFAYAGEQDGSAFANFTAIGGYKNSSKDHLYFTEPQTRPTAERATENSDLGFATTVMRPCDCDMCLQILPHKCLLQHIFKNIIGRQMFQRKKGIAARAATRSSKETTA